MSLRHSQPPKAPDPNNTEPRTLLMSFLQLTTVQAVQTIQSRPKYQQRPRGGSGPHGAVLDWIEAQSTGRQNFTTEQPGGISVRLFEWTTSSVGRIGFPGYFYQLANFFAFEEGISSAESSRGNEATMAALTGRFHQILRNGGEHHSPGTRSC